MANFRMREWLLKVFDNLSGDAQPGKWDGAGIARYFAKTLVLIGAYVLLVKAGLSFTPEGTDVTPVWPPSGLGTAALYILGARYWPAILLASLIGNSAFGYLTPPAIAMIIVVDTLEAVIAAKLLRRFRFRSQLARVRDVVLLIWATMFGSTAVAATLGTAVIYSDGQLALDAVPNAWFVYWISNVTANFTLAPLILTWASPTAVLADEMRDRRHSLLEAVGMAVILAVLSYSVWFLARPALLLEMEYIMFPLLMWAGLRFGSRLTAMAIAAVSLAAILGTSRGLGPFGHYPVYSALFMMQMYVSVYALTGLVVAAIAEERAAAKRQVSQARDSLEVTVAERTTEIRQAGAMMEAVLDNIDSAVIACDATGTITTANRAAKEIYDFSNAPPEPEMWSENYKLFRSDGITPLKPDEAPLLMALHGETFRDLEIMTKPSEEETRFLQVSGQPIETDSGVQGAVISAHDVTERKLAQRLRQLYQIAAVISNEAPDEEQAVLTILESVCTYIGWPIGHALHVEMSKGRPVAESSDWWYVADRSRLEVFRIVSQGKQFVPGEGLPGRVLNSGRAEWITDVLEDPGFVRLAMVGSPPLTSAVAFPVSSGASLVAILEFFTYDHVEPDHQFIEAMELVCTQLGRVYERAEATRKLMKMTLRDPLTGRPNRLAFLDVLTQAIAHGKRRSSFSFAVLFLDLDRFKIINDSLGHAAGDALLIEAADRISSCLREGDMMARLGGDEFTVYLDDLGQRSDNANAMKVATRINAELARPFYLGQEEAHVSSSIGIVVSGPEYTDPDVLLRDADAAMYRAKAAGRGRIEIFSSKMQTETMDLLRLENELRRGLEREEFRLHYQPVLELQSGRIIGFEALVRWEHPVRGLVSPAGFIDVCEESGLIIPLGQWVLNKGCQWLAERTKSEQSGSTPLTLNINVSPYQFSRGVIAAQVETALSSSGLPATQLKLEIVESALMKSSAEALSVMESLRTLGVQLLIDDFGTGYSSLSYLSQLPIDALKIDQSFVRDMTQNEHSAEIVRCIISMAAALRLHVVAEGIETAEQAETLIRLGCEYGQGYYYSRPLTSDAATKLIEQ